MFLLFVGQIIGSELILLGKTNIPLGIICFVGLFVKKTDDFEFNGNKLVKKSFVQIIENTAKSKNDHKLYQYAAKQ